MKKIFIPLSIFGAIAVFIFEIRPIASFFNLDYDNKTLNYRFSAFFKTYTGIYKFNTGFVQELPFGYSASITQFDMLITISVQRSGKLVNGWMIDVKDKTFISI